MNLERSKELRAKELRRRQEAFDPPAQLYRVPQWQEAIDGTAIDGSLLASKLRSEQEAAMARSEQAAAAAEWRGWLEPATLALAHEYLSFVRG